jgi:hypothetical protein
LLAGLPDVRNEHTGLTWNADLAGFVDFLHHLTLPALESWIGKEHAASWSSELSIYSTAPAGSVVSSLAPTNGWISERDLKRLWISERAKHTSGEAFTVDGLLYSSNAIFTLARQRDNSGGQLTINGGMVAADVGMLAAGGLHLNYDTSVTGLLGIRRYDRVAFRRKVAVIRVVRED